MVTLCFVNHSVMVFALSSINAYDETDLQYSHQIRNHIQGIPSSGIYNMLIRAMQRLCCEEAMILAPVLEYKCLVTICRRVTITAAAFSILGLQRHIWPNSITESYLSMM